MSSVRVAPSRVLPTLNVDGSRRWIRPKPSHGRHWRARRATAIALMFVFLAIPHVRIAGRPLVLLDLPKREFTLFGATFLPTETLLLMLFMVSIMIGVFLATALLGRVWCGWACPQTVYTEFLFRPIERFFEGGYVGSRNIDKAKDRLNPRRLAKYAVYAVLALILAHTFLAYFVGIEKLRVWVTRSPLDHPTSFFIMALTTLAVFLDFTYFREQVCMVACPYGRLQSVLLDRQSLIVAYDPRRGEPRMLGMKDRPATAGDCIECNACVQTCPTGIDIRDGLQMDCIHCTQCADACDEVMRKIGKPEGLIRYTSRESLEGKPRHMLRPRVVLYPVVLALFLGLFVYNLSTRRDAEVTVLRGLGAPFAEEADGRVANQLRVRVENRARDPRTFHVTILDASGAPLQGAQIIAPMNPLPVAAEKVETASLFVVLPLAAFHDGERKILVRVDDGRGFHSELPYELLGPERDSHEQERHDR